MLSELFLRKKIDYRSISSTLYKKNFNNEKYDISVIIPVRERPQFHEPVIRFLNKAKQYSSDFNINITFVEHSYNPSHAGCCQNSYIWIPSNHEEEFNKCLCFNMGFLYGANSDFYIFHDLDLLVPETFFANIDFTKDSVQTFKGKRVLYANEEMSRQIIVGQPQPVPLDDKHPGVTIGVPGAPGGSIMVSKERFIEVGGYDAEYFTGYSVEDQFFYNKLDFIQPMTGTESNDLIHLWHGDSYGKKTKEEDMECLLEWNRISLEERKELIRLKREHFKQFVI